MNSSTKPLLGLWKPHHLRQLYYGKSVVSKHLLASLPTPESKAFIITGSSLATKTPLVKTVESLLGAAHHAGTFANIKQHAPIAQLDQATDQVAKDPLIDTLISLGGGSPIDSTKVILHRDHEREPSKPFMTHICIPTTLSAAECTAIAGYTTAEGIKTAVNNPTIAPTTIFYDSDFAAHTPTKLWLATGIRALDHAMETMYHPSATEMPARMSAMWAAGQLFENLPKAAENHPKDDDLSVRLFIAAFASLGMVGLNLTAGLGLSHTMGYAMGSPYGIPHGETSCMSLAPVLQLKSQDPATAAQIARMLPYVSLGKAGVSGDAGSDAREVARRVEELVRNLGLRQGLKERGVDRGELGTIVQRATGGKGSAEVEKLVEGLYY